MKSRRRAAMVANDLSLTGSRAVRICLVYDCLFPHTVGGAERWYRELAERLEGPHEVTYLTRRQWETGDAGTPFQVLSTEAAATAAAARHGPIRSFRYGP